MADRQRVTREAILAVARSIVAADGVGALTYQAVATRLGVTKQAVIYWYPSKSDLGRDLSLTTLREEAGITTQAVAGALTAKDAIDRFVRALVAFHLADLGRFRMLYLSLQTAPPGEARAMLASFLDDVHSITGEMYGALEAKIAADRRYPGRRDARRIAVATHMAAVGLLTMVALGQAINDPLAHRTGTLVDAMVQLVANAAARS